MILQNIILLETQFFPSIPCFSAMIQQDAIILEKHEHFQKATYRNRCQIATAQGAKTITVPLKKGKNQQQIITDVQIADDLNWQRPLWRTLQSAYGNAPYWEHYAPVFEPFFLKKYRFLFDYNFDILLTLFKILKYDKKITVSFSNTYESHFTEGGVDMRNTFNPKTLPTDSKRYPQVFEDRHGFLPNLSIIDLVFCCGKQSIAFL